MLEVGRCMGDLPFWGYIAAWHSFRGIVRVLRVLGLDEGTSGDCGFRDEGSS